MDNKTTIGVVLTIAVVGALVLWYTLTNNPQACGKEVLDNTTHVFVTVDKLESGVSVTPSSCVVKPGQWVEWRNEKSVTKFQLHFGKETAGPEPAAVSAEVNGGLLWRTGDGSATAPPVSIKIREVKESACVTHPYIITANGGHIAPNPAIIIKPTAVAACGSTY